jgi:hypothetical protein
MEGSEHINSATPTSTNAPGTTETVSARTASDKFYILQLPTHRARTFFLRFNLENVEVTL